VFLAVRLQPVAVGAQRPQVGRIVIRSVAIGVVHIELDAVLGDEAAKLAGVAFVLRPGALSTAGALAAVRVSGFLGGMNPTDLASRSLGITHGTKKKAPRRAPRSVNR
jgi:hypothetical protein